MSRRHSRGGDIETTVFVSVDDVLDELSDEDLLEELENRGKEFRSSGKALSADTLRGWADDIDRGQAVEVARAMRLMAFEMQPALDVSRFVTRHPFLRFKS